MGPHPLLSVSPGERQPADSTRRTDEVSDCDGLQREPDHVLVGSVSR